MSDAIKSIHPYCPYIPEDAKKLIVGTIPPARFCTQGKKELYADDVDFYYGSRDNCFWNLMAEITQKEVQRENTKEAIEERKALLDSLKIGITDIIESCIHKEGKSDDKSLEIITRKPLNALLLQYPEIDTLIYTSRFVASQVNHIADKTYHSWSKENKLDGTIPINGKLYRVKILYSPSPNALRSVDVKKRLERYKAVFSVK